MKKYMLILLLIATTLVAQTAETPSAGTGTATDPYQISTWENLYWIRTNTSLWSKHFVQTQNIAFPSDIDEWNTGKGWEPLGNDFNNFSGTYDGNGKTISGLYINRPDQDHVGLFGKTNGADIKDLGLINTDIKGHMFTGALIGTSNATNITNCYSEGSLIGNDFIGGLVGTNNSGSVISYCRSSVNVTSSNSMGTGAGGLAGMNGDATIRHCSSTGDVSSHTMVGGLVGVNTSSNIYISYCNGNVTGNTMIGGFVGSSSQSSQIQICYAISDVYGNNSVGGFAGRNSLSMIVNSYSRGSVTCETTSSVNDVASFTGFVDQGNIGNCYSTNSVEYTGISNPTDKGFIGQIGTDGEALLADNFWDMDSSGQTDNIGGAFGRTAVEMRTDTTFEKWNFDLTWGICDTINDSYPHLYYQSPVPRVGIQSVQNTWDGSAKINGYMLYLGKPNPSQHGLCWNTVGEPDYNDEKIELGPCDSTGLFQVELSGLSNDTQYHIRAFVINDIDTSYSYEFTFTCLETGIAQHIPGAFELVQNYPNPFNPTTTIRFQIPEDCTAKVSIYDMSGRIIGTLVNDHVSAGYHSVSWDASAYPSGLYFYRLNAGSYSETKKMLLIK